MIPRAAYLAVGLAVALPGIGLAQGCDRAETALEAMFDSLHAENGRFSGESFAALSQSEKWFWTANLLDAQVRRLGAMLKASDEVPEDKMDTAIAVFLALDGAEPCFRGPDTDAAAQGDAPGLTARDRLRAEIEVIK